MRMHFFVNMFPVKFMLSTIQLMLFFPLPMIQLIQPRSMLYLPHHLVNRCHSLLSQHYRHKELFPIRIFLDVRFLSKTQTWISFLVLFRQYIYITEHIHRSYYCSKQSPHIFSTLILSDLEVTSKEPLSLSRSLDCKFLSPRQILFFVF